MLIRPAGTMVAGLLAGFALMAAPALCSANTTVSSDGADGALLVNGDGAGDQLAVSWDRGASKLLISAAGISETTSACADNGDTLSCSVKPAPLPGLPASAVFGFRGGDNTVAVDGSVPASLDFAFRSGAGVDRFEGGLESDNFDPGAGPDSVSGGAGRDTVIYGQRVTPVSVALDGSPTSGNELDGPPGARDRIGTDVEDIVGGNASDRLVGNALGNTIVGFKGRDVLIGLGGSDRLSGEGIETTFATGTASANRLYGGRGRDFLLGTTGGDALFGGPGIDRINAKDKQHEEAIDCGAGNDRRERATRDAGDPHPISC